MPSFSNTPDVDAQLTAFTEALAPAAKDAVYVKMAERILHLNALIADFDTPDSPFELGKAFSSCDTTILTLPSTIPTDSSSSPRPSSTTNKLRSLASSSTNGSLGSSTSAGSTMQMAVDDQDDQEEEKSLRVGMKTNRVFDAVGEVMEREGKAVQAICHTIRTWLTTVTPAVEEGNNTGVEIQELALSTLNVLHNQGSDCSGFLLSARTHRAGIVKLYLKSPAIEDRLLALAQSDKMEISAARQMICLLLTKYLDTMNIFQKNWQKICKPKGERERWD